MKQRLAHALSRISRRAVDQWPARSLIRRELAEIQARQSLFFNLRQVGFPHTLFPGQTAANATLLCFMLRVFDGVGPRQVLELGSGSSTRLTHHYIVHAAEAAGVCLENDAFWHGKVKGDLAMEADTDRGFTYAHAPMAEATPVDGRAIQWYDPAVVGPLLEGRRFDFVVIDGPPGRFPDTRLGVMNYLPHVLADDFVVLIDDVTNRTVNRLVDLMGQALTQAGRPYKSFELCGNKINHVFVSESWSFVQGL